VIVVPGPASPDLGLKIAKLLRAKVVPIEFKFFPDGESYVRFTRRIEDEEVIIVQTTNPPQDTRIMQLFLMTQTAADLGAKNITLVVPYLAYARQDKRFREGEAISILTVGKLFRALKVNRLITVNAHSPKMLSEIGVKVENLSAIHLLAEYFKRQGLKGVVSLAPGKKAMEMAIEAESVLKGGYYCIETHRDVATGKVKVETKGLTVRGKNIAIFDDIISTGGTMAESVKILKQNGARKVYVACVHPLLLGEAKEKILKSGAVKIIGTDTVPSTVSIVSVAPLIAKSIAEKS
jgi:ribose-phosphate pyrophosphokinase